MDGSGAGRVGRDAVAQQLADELVEQERVAAAGAVAGGGEGRVGLLPAALADERGGGRLAQRRRPHEERLATVAQLLQRRRVGGRGVGLRRAGGDDQRQRQPVEPGGEEAGEAQRRRVGPVGVVEQQHERPLGGEVGDQPVERVEHRERRVGRGLRRWAPPRPRRSGRGRDARGRLAGRARAPPRTSAVGRLPRLARRRSQQLPRDAVAVVVLQLAAGAGQHAGAGRLGVGARERQQARLADARVALDVDEPPGVPETVVDRCRERGDLDLTTEGRTQR